VVSGLGSALGLPCASDRFLKIPKNRKFMGGQDHLAVCAAGEALESAGIVVAQSPGEIGNALVSAMKKGKGKSAAKKKK